MDSKLEKYYNFIVNDLVKGTVLFNSGANQNRYIEFPFSKDVVSSFDFKYSESLKSPWPSNELYEDFVGYVRSKFGVGDNEMEDVWYMYVDKVLEKIS